MVAEILRDYGLKKGVVGPFEFVMKGLLLIAVYPMHRQWIASLKIHAMGRLLEVEPRVAYRHLGSYLFSGLAWSSRIRVLQAHYRFLSTLHDARFFNELLRQPGVELWNYFAGEHRLQIHLSGPESHREGDLLLTFRLNEQIVFKIAFSAVPVSMLVNTAAADECEQPFVLYVAQVQGAAGRSAEIRSCTQLCNAVAPQDLLMTSLAGIANAWDVKQVVGVGPQIQLSAKNILKHDAFDYAAFWARYHGKKCEEGHYFIDTPFVAVPVTQIVAKRQKRTLAKRRFKLRLSTEVARRVASRRADRCSPQVPTPSLGIPPALFSRARECRYRVGADVLNITDSED